MGLPSARRETSLCGLAGGPDQNNRKGVLRNEKQAFGKHPDRVYAVDDSLRLAAFAAEVTEQNPVLPDGVEFKEENTVYYDGEYYDKLTDALKAAAGKEGAILYCKPGADVGKMTHGHVCASLTVYGNGAFVSGGENDFEVDTYKGTSCRS